MLKKGLIFIVFFFLFGINLYLIINYYISYKIESQKMRILSEIEDNDLISDRHFSFSAAPWALGAVENEVILADGRSVNLRNFFRKYNSPLYDYSDSIVVSSDKYGFDYRLLPAIAMQESNLCKHIPEDSYNCWGYGIYGDNVVRFSSYQEGIEVVSKAIKNNYINKGYTTPESIMRKYTPNSSGSWADSINYFFRLLE